MPFAIACAATAYNSYFDYLETNLAVAKFIYISSMVKSLLLSTLAILLLSSSNIMLRLIGAEPYQFTNLSNFLLVAFVLISPILVRLTNRPYDLVSDTTLVVVYYLYIPITFGLWLLSLIMVWISLTRKEAEGKRRTLWIGALVLAPLLALILTPDYY